MHDLGWRCEASDHPSQTLSGCVTASESCTLSLPVSSPVFVLSSHPSSPPPHTTPCRRRRWRCCGGTCRSTRPGNTSPSSGRPTSSSTGPWGTVTTWRRGIHCELLPSALLLSEDVWLSRDSQEPKVVFSWMWFKLKY